MPSEWVFCIILIKFPLHWREHETICPVHSGDWWIFVSDHIHPILRNFEDPFNLQWRKAFNLQRGSGA